MHLPLSTVLAALLASSTAAAMPAGSDSPLAPRQMSNFRCQSPSLNHHPTVLRTMMFRDDFCADDCQHHDQLDESGGTAVEYGNVWRASGRRSIKFESLDERFNCDVTTWSGEDGRGLSLLLKGGEKNRECVSVLYGSFSYYCWRKELGPPALVTMPGPVVVELPAATGGAGRP